MKAESKKKVKRVLKGIALAVGVIVGAIFVKKGVEALTKGDTQSGSTYEPGFVPAQPETLDSYLNGHESGDDGFYHDQDPYDADKPWSSDEISDEMTRLSNGDFEEWEFDSEDEVKERIAELEDEYNAAVNAEDWAGHWDDVEKGINPWTGDELWDRDEIYSD